MTHNMVFINIETDHDTNEFVVNSIKGWWRLVTVPSGLPQAN
jgi:hypothetical protein